MATEKNMVTYRKPVKGDYIFGIRAVIEAIESGKEIEKLLVKRGLGGELWQELATLVREHSIPMQQVPVERINRVTRKNHQGVVAFISPITFQPIEEIIPRLFEEGKNPLVLVLDKVSDVRNFGAIARSAEVAGAHAIVIPEKGAAQINADAIKTSAGALHIIPVCRVKNLQKTVKFLKDSGLYLAAATEKGKKNYFEADLTSPLAIVMGAEDRGIEPELLRITDEWVKIPQLGEIDSLNVSVAASVLLFDAVRQRISIDA